VFGVGPQELIVVVLLVLIVFGPAKAAGVARDLGRFAGEARGQVEELKGELATTSSGEDREEEDGRRREPRARGRGGDALAGGPVPNGEVRPGARGARGAGPAREEAPPD
jgi:Sec-independent protein translocase protein TatA